MIEFDLADKKIEFVYELNHNYVRVNGKKIENLTELAALVPFLQEGSDAFIAAQIVNHFLKGNEFDVITDPDKFRKEYTNLVKQEGESPFREEPRTSDWGTYDVTNIKFPVITQEQLIFYTQKRDSRVPYIVSLTLPLKADGNICTYDLLADH